jgi:hypothetical protein
MNNGMKSWRLAAGAALLVSVTGLAGCYGAAYYHDAPPPHAPAYGYRWQQYDYFYYPSVGVYFHIPSGYYYYRDGRHWRRSLWLPPSIVILPRDRVHIRIKDKDPWRHHKEHQERYRPQKWPRMQDRDRMDRNRVEREQNRRLYREYREYGERRRR